MAEAHRDAASDTCRCGYTRDHAMVEKEPHYSFFGWCTLLFGISTLPTRIDYRCRSCKQSLGETTDLKVRRAHM